ncbi:MAG: hypothetical protein ABDI20_06960, partial [Candidatus Bipolaricaulaceae bacterium]
MNKARKKRFIESKRRLELVLPAELVARIDALAGKRGRRKFVEEALRAELRRRALEIWLGAGPSFRGL